MTTAYEAYFHDTDYFMSDMINECGPLAQKDGAQDTQHESVDVDGEPLFDNELTGQSRTRIQQNVRGGGYKENEDYTLCEAWMENGQDPICGS